MSLEAGVMTPEHHLLCEHRPGGIRVITLNRPDAMNAITMDMASQLSALLTEIASDAEARCIILTGAGDRAFSAGFDIKEMADFSGEQMRDAFVARDPLMLHIAAHPLPVIAALNGLAYGAGALIAAACDFRIAGPGSAFKVTAIGYGSANATWSLPRLVGPARAKDILMTGRVVLPDEGVAIGLFDRVATGQSALDLALQLAGEIADHAPAGVCGVKSLVDRCLEKTVAEGWNAEHQLMLQSFATQAREGSAVFNAFLSARPTNT
jgi:enoyl-CoA hydratase/carnithine racemase